MSMKKIILSLIAVLALTIAAYAVPTASGSAVSNEVTISGTNFNSDTDAYDTTVTAIYGDTLNKATDPSEQSANVNEIKDFVYIIHNTGNIADSFTVYVGSPDYRGTADAWTYAILQEGDTKVSSSTDTIGWTVNAALALDGVVSFTVRIKTSDNPDSAADGDSLVLTMLVIAQNAGLHQRYVGDNGTVYADTTPSHGENNHDTPLVYISSANFTIAKAGAVTLNSNPSNPVPGATIEYTITYNNIGSGNGNNVVISDELDTSVVVYTSGDTDVSGWTFEWSADNSAWSTDAINAGNSANVRYIRWSKDPVPAAETNDITYSVWIK